MNLEHWESYYRGGALVSCPMGLEPGYTGEVRDAWVTFFATLPDGARILDIGTGNGAVALIAKETAATLGRSFAIHGVDLAQIDPVRHVPKGATLLAGIEFHPGVPAEQLPFEANAFDAVSGQYALEYTQRDRALAEIFRVLIPGGRGQFLLHHRDSVIVRNADESLRHAALVLDDTKVFRLLRRYLEAERDTPKTATGPWQELVAAGNRLQAEARASKGSLLLPSTVDALQRLFEQRGKASLPVLLRAADQMEQELRASVRRLQDLASAAFTEAELREVLGEAEAAGFVDVQHREQRHGGQHLVAWRVNFAKP